MSQVRYLTKDLASRVREWSPLIHSIDQMFGMKLILKNKVISVFSQDLGLSSSEPTTKG